MLVQGLALLAKVGHLPQSFDRYLHDFNSRCSTLFTPFRLMRRALPNSPLRRI
jgi:hypothetical protein